MRRQRCNDKSWKDLQRLDMYSVNPSYKLPAYTSWCGFGATIVTTVLMAVYVFTTLTEYIKRPPELALQGLAPVDGVSFPVPNKISVSLEYQDAEGKKVYLDMSNTDRFFRIIANHVTIENQDNLPRVLLPLQFIACDDNGALCIDQGGTGSLKLTGSYESPVYQYIEIKIFDCWDYATSPESECAAKDEIAVAILNGAKVVLSINVQDYDWTLYPKPEAVSQREHKHRSYLLSPISHLYEVNLQGRSIDHEKPHLGSPPLPEGNTKILSYGYIEKNQAPKQDQDGYSYMSFFIRLSDSLRQEETSYWIPGILDLVAMWGALFSFLSTLSIGLIATSYNSHRSHRSFKRRGGKDVRLYDKQDFDSNGRLVCGEEEMKIPTTLFGELRAYAENEQRKKKNAWGAISVALMKFREKKSAAKELHAIETAKECSKESQTIETAKECSNAELHLSTL